MRASLTVAQFESLEKYIAGVEKQGPTLEKLNLPKDMLPDALREFEEYRRQLTAAFEEMIVLARESAGGDDALSD